MGLFDKAGAAGAKPQPIGELKEASELFFPVNAVFRGDMETDGDARIEGTIDGNVKATKGSILLGPRSRITGNVACVDLSTAGTIQGNITAKGRLSILAGAKVEGDVCANAFVVEESASFQGKVVIGPQGAEAAAPAPKAEPAPSKPAAAPQA